MAIRENKKYTPEELSKFNETLNKFYSLRILPSGEDTIEVEVLNTETLKEKFCASKPEVKRETRLADFQNLYEQWRQWKFAAHFAHLQERQVAEGTQTSYPH